MKSSERMASDTSESRSTRQHRAEHSPITIICRGPRSLRSGLLCPGNNVRDLVRPSVEAVSNGVEGSLHACILAEILWTRHSTVAQAILTRH